MYVLDRVLCIQVFRAYSNGQEFECTKLMDNLTSYAEDTKVRGPTALSSTASSAGFVIGLARIFAKDFSRGCFGLTFVILDLDDASTFAG